MLRIYGNCALGPFVSPEAFTLRFSDHWTESASKGKSPEVEHEEPIKPCNVEGLDVRSRYNKKIRATLIPPKPKGVCSHRVGTTKKIPLILLQFFLHDEKQNLSLDENSQFNNLNKNWQMTKIMPRLMAFQSPFPYPLTGWKWWVKRGNDRFTLHTPIQFRECTSLHAIFNS